MSISSVINVLLSPFKLFIAINVFIVVNTIIIPFSLLLNIMIYTPLVKLPIVIPLKYLLELQDVKFTDYHWLSHQVELFVLTLFHFVMVSIYIGITVGVFTWVNLSAIRYVLTLPLELTEDKQSKNRIELEPATEKKNKTTITPDHRIQDQDTGYYDFLNQVVVPDVVEPRQQALSAQTLPSEISPEETHHHVYEDDDGYIYTGQLRNRTHGVDSSDITPSEDVSNPPSEEEQEEEEQGVSGGAKEQSAAAAAQGVAVDESYILEPVEEEETQSSHELSNIPEETEEEEMFSERVNISKDTTITDQTSE